MQPERLPPFTQVKKHVRAGFRPIPRKTAPPSARRSTRSQRSSRFSLNMSIASLQAKIFPPESEISSRTHAPEARRFSISLFMRWVARRTRRESSPSRRWKGTVMGMPSMGMAMLSAALPTVATLR